MGVCSENPRKQSGETYNKKSKLSQHETNSEFKLDNLTKKSMNNSPK